MEITDWIAVIAVIFSIFQYVGTKKAEERRFAFQTYHKLIADLVGADKKEGTPKLDSQIAVIYELRNYESYSDASLRILKGLKETWKETEHRRIIEEIDLTITHLENLPPKCSFFYCIKNCIK